MYPKKHNRNDNRYLFAILPLLTVQVCWASDARIPPQQADVPQLVRRVHYVDSPYSNPPIPVPVPVPVPAVAAPSEPVAMPVQTIYSDTVHSDTVTDSLPNYLETAARNNPGVQAAFSQYRASLQRVPQAGDLPDPQLDIGFFFQPMEIVEGRQVAQIQLMQMFPWIGTRQAARTEAQHRARMAYEQFRETRNQLWLDVYTQWYTMCRLQQQLNIYRKNKQLALNIEELALRNVSSGGTQSDVLRIRLDIAELDNDIENILSNMTTERIKFNILLNRPADSPIYLPDCLTQIQFAVNEHSAMEQIRHQNPTLAMYAQEEASYIAKAEKDRRMSYPMFGVGLQYMVINESPHATDMGSMNGKDMVMPMVSVSLPVFRNKYRAQQRENAYLQQASRQNFTNTLNSLEAELHRTKNELDNAARKIALYRKQSELVQTAYDMTVQEFASGKGDLTNVIQVQNQLLDYELKTADAVADFNTMAANMQKLRSATDLP